MKEGMNQDKIQELNKSLVLNLIREEGVCSRALLSKLSGLNKATITYTVNEFILSECGGNGTFIEWKRKAFYRYYFVR